MSRRLPWAADTAADTEPVRAKARMRARKAMRSSKTEPALDLVVDRPVTEQKRVQIKLTPQADDLSEEQEDDDEEEGDKEEAEDNEERNGEEDEDEHDIEDSLPASPAKDPAKVEVMELRDKPWRMVEDEFFDVAREIAAPLHAEELLILTNLERLGKCDRTPSLLHDRAVPTTPTRKRKSTFDYKLEDIDLDTTSKIGILLTSPVKDEICGSITAAASPSKRRSQLKSRGNIQRVDEIPSNREDPIGHIIRETTAESPTNKYRHSFSHQRPHRINDTSFFEMDKFTKHESTLCAVSADTTYAIPNAETSYKTPPVAILSFRERQARRLGRGAEIDFATQLLQDDAALLAAKQCRATQK
ncbi:uncharacterized protein V1518DRAFT_417131 [Limtongia smithiae]|uniref:uncharacterized protein n=1 Tax=Limtongia smithiae TaxID=1125753 RepID=UPI0034CD5DC0